MCSVDPQAVSPISAQPVFWYSSPCTDIKLKHSKNAPQHWNQRHADCQRHAQHNKCNAQWNLFLRPRHLFKHLSGLNNRRNMRVRCHCLHFDSVQKPKDKICPLCKSSQGHSWYHPHIFLQQPLANTITIHALHANVEHAMNKQTFCVCGTVQL